MICPSCNAQLPNEARFCPTCGTPVQQAADRAAAVSVTLGAPSPHDFQPTAGPLFPVDTRLDTFVIKGVIGRGGSGDVYEAVDDFDGSTYALKVIPDANERAFESIRDEFAARKRINDFSHIVRAYQPRHVESPAGPVVVFPMERLASSLSEEIRPLQSMSEEQREETILTTILPDILAGLQECHRVGILHLDIKPRNILYDRANQVYKVTDFGISRFRTDFGAGSVTEQSVQGTIAYAAPEQLSGGDLDERTDVYALGVLLNTLMYGSPGASGGESSSRLQTIIDNCVHRSPARRYQSVESLNETEDREKTPQTESPRNDSNVPSAFPDIVAAIRAGDHQTVERLLDASPEAILETDSTGRTLLHHAIAHDNPHAAKKLIGMGSDIDHRDKNGNTPLHRAIQQKLSATILGLIMNGADRSIQNNDGDRPDDLPMQGTVKTIMKSRAYTRVAEAHEGARASRPNDGDIGGWPLAVIMVAVSIMAIFMFYFMSRSM